MTSIMDYFYPLAPPNRRRPTNRHMQVLCLGLSRSGTDSIKNALTILGYKDVYHGFVITSKQRGDCAFWIPLMEEKYANDHKPVERNLDFDSVLGDAEAVTDGPANVFGEELMAYYSDAKVVLNRRRDVDAWYRSMEATAVGVFAWPLWTLSWFDTGLYWLWRNFDLVIRKYYYGDFDKYGKQGAVDHYARLEKHMKARGRGYLDWGVEDGWEPLCRFLGKPIPDVPFPDGNKGGGQFEQNFEEATEDMIYNALRNMGVSLFTSVALGGAAWYGRSRGLTETIYCE